MRAVAKHVDAVALPASYPRQEAGRDEGATTLEQSHAPAVGAGPHADFTTAYLAYRAAIYNYVRRLVVDETDAEDLTLAAFEKALRAWERRPADNELRPWLFRIATNTCLDELRRRRRIRWQPWSAFISLFHPSQVAPDDPEETALRNERVALIRAALAQLSPRDRAALLMREHHGLFVDEIGEALGISRAAAKVTLFRARERLRDAYVQLGGELPGHQTAASPPPVRHHAPTHEQDRPGGRRLLGSETDD